MADSKAQAKAGADDGAGARKKKMILIGVVAAVRRPAGLVDDYA